MLQLTNARGERRAMVPFRRLEDLWFLWSRCNLACTHCYVGSSPHNDTLQMMAREEILPYLKEAGGLGVRRIYFTGGEPFVHPQLMSILDDAMEVAPVTVLTNGVGPIERHLDALAERRGRLQLRVSLDHFEEARHDAIRGAGMFRRTVRTVRELCRRGLRPIITATPVVFEETPIGVEEAEARFRELFDGGVEVKIIPFTLQMGSELTRTGARNPELFLTEAHLRGTSMDSFQCHTSRCLQKIKGQIWVFPCPIIYQDSDYALGRTLADSFGPVPMSHHGCVYFCWKNRGRCGDPVQG